MLLRYASALLVGTALSLASMWMPSTSYAASSKAETSPASYTPDVTFTLRTSIAEGKLVFIGVGGGIDGKVNPALQVDKGKVVQITLVNDDGAEHDVVFPEFGAQSDKIAAKGSSSVIVFRATREGTFAYFCSIPGHRAAGMDGQIRVGRAPEKAAETPVASVVRDAADLPGPIGHRGPRKILVDLETVEVHAQLAKGAIYNYWTFNGKVPGPFIRVRQGDTVEIHLKNAPHSRMIHSVDFHAVTGPGGGAVATQAAPGQERAFIFKTLNSGLYVYHCATPMVAHHIANGMYGLILVEPEEGLPKVDREFYVMQGELYTRAPFGHQGSQEFSVEKLLAERPEYLIFNGAVGALTEQVPLRAHVGETVRIFFGVGGPNITSAFHVIGEIFDRVYEQGAVTTAPLKDVQTTLVPPGGSTMVEFKLEVPGRYILVDHALARLERGLVGFLIVSGKGNPDVYQDLTGVGGDPAASGHR